LIKGVVLDIDIIFKIAGVVVLTAVINQILKLSGKEEITTFVTLAGIIIVLFSITSMISDLFSTVKSLFSIY
jgi:stage III sporulation protein AC